MKFLCSVLILAGVFALNDAFPSSSDDHLRLIRDQLILEDLREMVNNRDSSSMKCTGDYLEKLNICLDKYNTNVKKCDDAAQNAINQINNDTSAKIEEFNKNITGSCSKSCSLDSSEDNLDCISDESSQGSRLLSEISVAASTLKVEMIKAIDDAQGIQNVCTQVAYSDYSSESQIVENEFKKCVNKKEAA